jgi:hypothetical protein|uniref:Uncharacterized protein n=1 Tax=Picea glauca TaxID=3330 RepID=A0A117NH31_PICGL|nr:hypothetical protein ABT39_MTgene5935 [Picea glauca]
MLMLNKGSFLVPLKTELLLLVLQKKGWKRSKHSLDTVTNLLTRNQIPQSPSLAVVLSLGLKAMSGFRSLERFIIINYLWLS